MAMEDVLTQIDAEIERLTQARELLSDSPTKAPKAVTAKRRGRPPGVKQPAKKVSAKKTPAKKGLSAAGRKAISDAMKKRHAAKNAGSVSVKVTGAAATRLAAAMKEG